MSEIKHTIGEFTVQPLPTYRAINNLTGKIFSRLTVLGFYGYRADRANHDFYWICQCQCGTTKLVQGACLRRGTTQSCGCLGQEHALKANIMHNETGKTTEHSSYTHSKNRCNNPNHHAFAQYGGRGIKFLFDSYQEFLAYMGRKPSPKHSLDRIDVNGHYEVGNLRWATQTEQCRNTRNNRLLTINNESKTLSEWSERSGVAASTLSRRKNIGWCNECAINIKPRKGRCSHINHK